METARKARDMGLSRQKTPQADADFAGYLRSTHLTWTQKDTAEPWGTSSTAGLEQVWAWNLFTDGKAHQYHMAEHGGGWRHRKLQELGHAISFHPEQQGQPIVGI